MKLFVYLYRPKKHLIEYIFLEKYTLFQKFKSSYYKRLLWLQGDP